jgi:hypothetical protein
MTITYGAAGTPCDNQATVCQPGLYCDTSIQKCAAQLGQGAACSAGVDSCQAPLFCQLPPNGSATGTCQPPGGAGAACQLDQECASPLLCAKGMCANVIWNAPGQPCDGSLTRCAVGTCSGSGGTNGDTCPMVIADGASCSVGTGATTCDYQANCVLTGDAGVSTTGTCVLGAPTCM